MIPSIFPIFMTPCEGMAPGRDCKMTKLHAFLGVSYTVAAAERFAQPTLWLLAAVIGTACHIQESGVSISRC